MHVYRNGVTPKCWRIGAALGTLNKSPSPSRYAVGIWTVVAVLLLSLLLPSWGSAEPLGFSMVYEGKNLFRVIDRDLFVQTKVCTPPATKGAPLLIYDEAGPDFVAWPNGQRCPVRAMLGRIDMPRDRFSVNLSKRANEWYEVFGLNLYLRTSLCVRMVIGEEAMLNVLAKDDIRLQFSDGQMCAVKGVYGRLVD